jgi:hypothetical protein
MNEDEVRLVKRLVQAAEAITRHLRSEVGIGAGGPGSLIQLVNDLESAASSARRVIRESQ